MHIPENSQYVLFGGAFLLANKLQAVADRRVTGLTTKQWFLLRNLADMPAEPMPTISTLASETDTTRQNVTKMLEGLQHAGFVEMDIHPEDRRTHTVALTDEGKQMLVQVAKQAQGFFEELFSGISTQECDAAANVVVKMIGKLHEMQERVR